jgi:hypothetical protein
MMQDPQPQPFSFDTLPYYDNTFSHEFGSEAANLEYAILSSMLNGNGFAVDGYGNSNGNAMLIHSPLDGGSLNLGGGGPTSSHANGGYLTFRPPSTSTSPSGVAASFMSPPRLQDTAQNLFPPPTGSDAAGGPKPDLSALRSTTTTDGSGNAFPGGQGNLENGMGQAMYGDGQQQQHQHQQQQQHSGSGSGAGSGSGPNASTMTGEEAYRAVTKPYPYAQSYHYLVKHLKQRYVSHFLLFCTRALLAHQAACMGGPGLRRTTSFALFARSRPFDRV